jgi:hypothetical protein
MWQAPSQRVAEHTSTSDDPSRVVVLSLPQLRNLIKLVGTDHEPVPADELLQFGRVDQGLASTRMTKRCLVLE